MNGVMKKFDSQLKKCLGPGVQLSVAYPWLDERCPSAYRIEEIVPSPEQALLGYRNKCEFSAGKSSSDQVTLGFMMGLYREGTVAVSDPASCVHVSPMALKIAAWMQDYLRTETTLSVYDRVKHTGHWRIVMVRTQHTGDGT